MEINIKDKNGLNIGTLSGNIIFCFKDNTIEATDYNPNTLYISLKAVNKDNIYREAFNKLIEYYRENPYILSINGSLPTYDGNFFINGSICSSVYNENNSIYITDLCPACNSLCSLYYNLKRQFEENKAAINVFKDVNIYTDEVISNRLNYLKTHRIVSGELANNCSDGTLDNSFRFNVPKSTELLGQYISVVHMWNYLVERINNKTNITTTTENNAGFMVQTKRSFINCNSSSNIKCIIEVKPADAEGSIQDNVSVYIQDPEASFKPFPNNDLNITSNIEHISATHKIINIIYESAKITGTYIAVVKVLPFIYVTFTDSKGNPIDMNLDNWNWEDSTIVNPDTGESTYLYSIKSNISTINAASLDDYNKNKIYPSKSTLHKNLWSINIRWQLMDPNDPTIPIQEYADSYFYTGNGLRVPMDNLLTDTVI